MGCDPYELPGREWKDNVHLWSAITYVHVCIHLTLNPSPYTKDHMLNCESFSALGNILQLHSPILYTFFNIKSSASQCSVFKKTVAHSSSPSSLICVKLTMPCLAVMWCLYMAAAYSFSMGLFLNLCPTTHAPNVQSSVN